MGWKDEQIDEQLKALERDNKRLEDQVVDLVAEIGRMQIRMQVLEQQEAQRVRELEDTILQLKERNV